MDARRINNKCDNCECVEYNLIILSIAKENIILCHDCLDELTDLINNIHLICPLNEQEK